MKIDPTPLHGGRISPLLYGGFIELLDDLVPGMWAEMLNDRSFEGVVPAAWWSYYQGAPNTCDRAWDRGDTWTLDTANPFNGTRCARLDPRPGRRAVLSQRGIAVRRGMSYRFEGALRAGASAMRPRVVLESELPDGTSMVLGRAELESPAARWAKLRCDMTSCGTTARATFALEVDGAGSLWADKLSLMPADNLEGWRRDVVEAVRDARPGLLRWGGSTVDPGGYQWKAGIGSRDRRTPFLNVPWGRMDSNDVGIDEFLQLCRLAEAEPLVCVSFADGARSARELVAYCNSAPESEWGGRRAQNGHPQPWGVRYWQVGNELGDERYTRGCAEICRAIKAADSGAVVLSSYPSAALLAEAGEWLAYVCPHHYEPDLAAHAASIDAAVRDIASAGLDHEIKVGVTEWNITGGWWGNGRGRLLTLEAALYAARYLNLLHRRSDVVGLACRSNMTNSFGSGMIQTSPDGLYLTPSYHVMRLYARHSRPVPVTLRDPPEGSDASACVSDDGAHLTLFVVNTRNEPLEVAPDLAGFGTGWTAVGGEVVCDTLALRQPDVMNHAAAPNRVRTVPLDAATVPLILPPLCVAALEYAAAPGRAAARAPRP